MRNGKRAHPAIAFLFFSVACAVPFGEAAAQVGGGNTELSILLGGGNGTFVRQPVVTLVPGGDLFSACNEPTEHHGSQQLWRSGDTNRDSKVIQQSKRDRPRI